jgi:multicomponent Na+:H+ antiporter subunit G
MTLLIDILSGLSIAIGVIALVTGSLGLIRLPDLYSRTHAVGMMDTAGVGFIILGLIIHEGFTLITVKLAAVGIFLFFTSPIATHAVAQVAMRSGVKPVIDMPASPKAPKKAAPKKAAPKKAAPKKAGPKKAASKKAGGAGR